MIETTWEVAGACFHTYPLRDTAWPGPGCDDCAFEESRVINSGGKVERSKMSIGEYGFISLVVDTEGNMIGLHSMR